MGLTAIMKKALVAVKVLAQGDFEDFAQRVRRNVKIAKAQRREKHLPSDAVVLPEVEIIVTERCTLKCQGCANLMQYYNDPQHMPLSQVCRDIDLLMSRADFIRVLRIMGGEPFMYKELPELLSHITKYKDKIGHLTATTNGTVVPNAETLNAIKKANVDVSISDYGIVSKNLDGLIKELGKHNILYRRGKIDWHVSQKIIDGSSRTEDQVQAVFHDCKATCTSVANGKFYFCPFLAHGETLRAFPANPKNHVDLLDGNTTKTDIKQYVSEGEAYPGCRYCSGNNRNAPSIPTAEQIKEPLLYRKFD